MIPLLRATAERIGAVPRPSFSLYLPPSSYLWPTDPIRWAEADEALVAEQGELVMGVVVSTQTEMFRPGIAAQPGIVVFPQPGTRHPMLYELLELGDTLWEQRSSTDAALWAFVPHLNPDAHPCFVPVPPRLACPTRVAISRIAISRRLPGGFLAAPFIPLLVHPNARSAIMLPVDYWADNLVRTFREWKLGY